MSALLILRRVGHQGRLRPVFDGAMAALLRGVPTIGLSTRRIVDGGHGAPTTFRDCRTFTACAPLPTLQIPDEVIE
jgi:hypothetical protein